MNDVTKEESLELPQEVQESFLFPIPSEEEAAFLLRELEWGDHFIGVEMNPSAGSQDIYIYSLKEVVRFLKHGTAGMGLSSGGKGSISWFDIDGFILWVRNSLKDTLLADQIQEETMGEEFFHGKIQKLGHLVDIRYSQLKGVLQTEEEAAEEAAEEA